MSSMNGDTSACTPRLGVGRARRVDAALARLVPHVQREPGLRERERHHGVQARGAQAAADDEQAQRALAPAKRVGGRRLRAISRAPDCRRRCASMPGGNASGNAASTRRARCASSGWNSRRWRSARGSRSGRRVSHAATPPGPVTKPPKPTTSCGRRRRMTPQRLPDGMRQLERRGEQRRRALAAQAAHRRATRSRCSPPARRALRGRAACRARRPRATRRAAGARARAPETRGRRCRRP